MAKIIVFLTFLLFFLIMLLTNLSNGIILVLDRIRSRKKMKRYKFPTNASNFFINYDRVPYLETHCHDYWEFTIVTKGTILHKINGFERIISENTLLVLRPDDTHSLNKADEKDIVYINIAVRSHVLKMILSALSPDLYDFLTKGDFVEFSLGKSTTTYFANLFNKYQITLPNTHERNDFLATIFVSVIRELLLCMNHSRQKLNYSTTVNEFIEHMRKQENLTLSIEDIIKNMNYSHCHIIRLFKKETGTTPSQYFLTIKLNCARILLETTNLSVLDIASTVGFSSLGHFTKVFKNQYSLPPANYRRKWNNYYNSFDEVNNGG